MKKALAAAALSMASIGSTALVAAPAVAADPYPGTVPTYCHVRMVDREIGRGQHVKIDFRVNTGGNGRPRGTTTIRIEKFNHNHENLYSRYYNHYSERWRFPPRHHTGRWLVVVHFHAKNGSVYQGCRDRTRFHVHR